MCFGLVSSFCVNIRAVTQYGDNGGNGTSIYSMKAQIVTPLNALGSNLKILYSSIVQTIHEPGSCVAIKVGMVNHLSVMLDQCPSALEELESLLLHTLIEDSGASIYSMKAHIVTPLNALNTFLKISPADVFKKG
ncbi:hypothetical protein H5410_004123 [Solanum commersonii]|uniref:DUF7880 domain-containing protein n=1 Tax=Solanum commersonii TaxID=4109 RepID=A0A9J6B6S2_SOLCO|nr:hypothetical protein H5410_004123 [Solanum commersonii]